MAYINATDGVISGTHTPAAAQCITKTGWGIDSQISGYIIQNLNISHDGVTDVTQDQKGLTIGELLYDETWSADFTVIGNYSDETGELTGYKVGEAVTLAGKQFVVTSTKFIGTYNGKKQWQCTAKSYKAWPTA